MSALREAFADVPQDRIELLTLDVRDEARAQAAAGAAMRRFGRIGFPIPILHLP